MSLRSTVITEEGRRNRRLVLLFVWVTVGIVVLNWIMTEFGRAGVSTGPSGSIFVTDTNGSAALAELLTRLGAQVTPAIQPFSGAIDADTVVVVDPPWNSDYGPDEVAALSDFVDAGGRLVFAGRAHPGLIGTILPEDLGYGYSAQAKAPIRFPLASVGGTIDTDGVRSFSPQDPYLPLAGDTPVVEAIPVGRGLVVAVSDGSVLWNLNIADNASWAVSAIGTGRVVFDEVRHGFDATPSSDSSSGIIAALPTPVRRTLWLLVPVLVLAMIVAGRRLGPAESDTRPLAPPRRELVDAVGAALARTDDPLAAGDPIATRLAVTVARRLGLPAEGTHAAMVAGSERLGVDPADLARGLDPATEEDVAIAARTLAGLNERNQP